MDITTLEDRRTQLFIELMDDLQEMGLHFEHRERVAGVVGRLEAVCELLGE
jgi:hypothetical protein